MTKETQQLDGEAGAMNQVDRLRRMSVQELMALGLDNVVYVRPVEVDGATAIAVFAANGRQIAVAPDLRAAVTTAWENGLSPVTVH